MKLNRSTITSLLIIMVIVIIGVIYWTKPKISEKDINIVGVQGTKKITLENSNSKFNCVFTEDVVTLNKENPTKIECTSKKKWLSIFTMSQELDIIPSNLNVMRSLEEIENDNEEGIESLYHQFYQIFLNSDKLSEIAEEDLRYILVKNHEEGQMFILVFKQNDREGVYYTSDTLYVSDDNIVKDFNNNELKVYNPVIFEVERLVEIVEGINNHFGYRTLELKTIHLE